MPPNQRCARTVYRTASLHKESERLKTYRDWALDFLEPRHLAKGGFYYTNEDDIVRCAFCGVEIGCWEQEDDPDEDHKKWSPNCDFVNGRECGNIPMSDNEEVSNDDSGIDTCGPYGCEVLPFSGPERSVLLRDPERLGILKTGGPVSSTFSTYESRLRSFESWPKGDVQSPQKLAEAGFYYSKLHDNTLCFHCGGGLKNWEATDDPWVEHARWFQKCGFVNIQKGKKFVEEAVQKKLPILSAENATELSSSAEPLETSIPPPESRVQEEELNCEDETKESETPESSETSTSPCCSTTSSASREIELCRICYLRERAIVFLPCGHFVSCTQCAPSLTACAVCRKPYQATVRAYLS